MLASICAVFLHRSVISRAHSFPEFREIWVFRGMLSRGIWRGIRLFTTEFDAFHSNNYFFTENDLKVGLALLQVCLR